MVRKLLVLKIATEESILDLRMIIGQNEKHDVLDLMRYVIRKAKCEKEMLESIDMSFMIQTLKDKEDEKLGQNTEVYTKYEINNMIKEKLGEPNEEDLDRMEDFVDSGSIPEDIRKMMKDIFKEIRK